MTVPLSLPARRIGSLQRPGCRLHYEVTGEGPAIIFAHGLGGNQMSWWQQIAHFAPRYICVALPPRVCAVLCSSCWPRPR